MFQADKKWKVLIKWLPKDWFKEFRSMYITDQGNQQWSSVEKVRKFFSIDIEFSKQILQNVKSRASPGSNVVFS